MMSAENPLHSSETLMSGMAISSHINVCWPVVGGSSYQIEHDSSTTLLTNGKLPTDAFTSYEKQSKTGVLDVSRLDNVTFTEL